LKIVLFTDTIGDLNGVSRFLQDMAEKAVKNGDDLQIIASTAKYCPDRENIHNFLPRFRIRMPYYRELDLAFPHAEIIESFVRTESPDLIHISTPGPVGILGRKIAKKMNIPMLGTYHTDFPAYIRDITGSDFLKRLTDRWMRHFYKEFVHVFSRSEIYAKVMHDEIGIAQEKISYIRHGTNLKRFSPGFRMDNIWQIHGLHEESVKVLYVGRLSREKNIPFLLDVWAELKKKFPDIHAELALVGEGRCKKKALEMRETGVRYIGPILGEMLSSFYASADLFVFPSATDTLGQVVMEASASGIGVIVSDVGGPSSLLSNDEKSGYALDASDTAVWVETLQKLIEDKALRKALGSAGEAFMRSFPIEHSYEDFIRIHQSCFNRIITVR
jgi:glycosyltransferase involved in cell wall biosynthesis